MTAVRRLQGAQLLQAARLEHEQGHAGQEEEQSHRPVPGKAHRPGDRGLRHGGAGENGEGDQGHTSQSIIDDLAEHVQAQHDEQAGGAIGTQGHHRQHAGRLVGTKAHEAGQWHTGPGLGADQGDEGMHRVGVQLRKGNRGHAGEQGVKAQVLGHAHAERQGHQPAENAGGAGLLEHPCQLGAEPAEPGGQTAGRTRQPQCQGLDQPGRPAQPGKEQHQQEGKHKADHDQGADHPGFDTQGKELVDNDGGDDQAERGQVKGEADGQRRQTGGQPHPVAPVEHGHVAQFAQTGGEHVDEHVAARGHQQQVKKPRDRILGGTQDEAVAERLEHGPCPDGRQVEEQAGGGNGGDDLHHARQQAGVCRGEAEPGQQGEQQAGNPQGQQGVGSVALPVEVMHVNPNGTVKSKIRNNTYLKTACYKARDVVLVAFYENDNPASERTIGARAQARPCSAARQALYTRPR